MFEPIGFIVAYEITYFTYKFAPTSFLTTPSSPRPGQGPPPRLHQLWKHLPSQGSLPQAYGDPSCCLCFAC